MSDPFLGEIKIISFAFPPKGWAFCNGQLLPINQNQALFSLLGTTYGGDGRVNFGLPNFQGRVPVHVGNGITLGERLGEESHTLNTSELPAHIHTIPADATANGATTYLPSTTSYFANTAPTQVYTKNTGSGVTMNPAMLAGTAGGSQAHENRSPYLVLNFVIALQGIFPSQS